MSNVRSFAAKFIQNPNVRNFSERLNSPSKLALVLIDCQKEFELPQGRLFIDDAPRIHDKKVEVLNWARGIKIPIIHVHRCNPVGFVESDRQAQFDHLGGYCINDFGIATPGLEPITGEHLVIKTGNSAFDSNYRIRETKEFKSIYPAIEKKLSFGGVLEENKITDVVLIGTQLKRCIFGTTLDLLFRNYNVSIISDAVARQSIDNKKKISEDVILNEYYTGKKMDIELKRPINSAVSEHLYYKGAKILPFNQFKSFETAKVVSR